MEIKASNKEIAFLLIGFYLGIIINHLDLWMCW